MCIKCMIDIPKLQNALNNAQEAFKEVELGHRLDNRTPKEVFYWGYVAAIYDTEHKAGITDEHTSS